MEWIFSLDTINLVAKEFWQKANGVKVIAFHGEMGSGKTTFIHALCDIKKIREVAGSPTFSIINEYTFDENGVEKKIYHIDLYRLKDEAEAINAGVEDCFYSDHICLVEWPEKTPRILPDATLHVCISVINSTNRKLLIKDK